MDPMLFATAYALSTSIGLRPFLTLALASLALHFGYLHVAHPFLGLGGTGASLVLGALAIAEFAADKIPVVDHALQAMHFAVKPVLAALLVDGTLPNLGPDDAGTYALAGLGALNAFGVNGALAAVRGASTVTTAGIANPAVSLIEDATALGAALLALFVPVAGALVALLATIALVLLGRAVLRRARSARSAFARP